MSEVSIADFSEKERRELIKYVYEHTELAGFFKQNMFIPRPSLTEEDIDSVFSSKIGGPDYLAGRLWRLGTFTDDIVNPSRYDRDMGQGEFAKLVQNYRNLTKK